MKEAKRKQEWMWKMTKDGFPIGKVTLGKNLTKITPARKREKSRVSCLAGRIKNFKAA